jgi:hypothetical protein
VIVWFSPRLFVSVSGSASTPPVVAARASHVLCTPSALSLGLSDPFAAAASSTGSVPHAASPCAAVPIQKQMMAVPVWLSTWVTVIVQLPFASVVHP